MRAMSFVGLVVFCTVGLVACSDDDGGTPGAGGTDQEVGGLQGQSGSTTGGSGGSGGSAGAGQGGSMNGAAGSAMGDSGAGGEGMGGGMGGAGGEVPDAGPVAEPDAGGEDPGGEDPGGEDPGGEDPGDETVTFADAFEIFRARCAGCHGNPNGGLPSFAQANEDAAFAVAVANAEDIAGRVDGSGGNIMPPGCGGGPGQGNCLSVEQVELIQTWVDSGTPR